MRIVATRLCPFLYRLAYLRSPRKAVMLQRFPGHSLFTISKPEARRQVMDKWIDVVTNPLGIAGFALFLVFTFVSRSRRPLERNLFIGLAGVALLAGLGLAYRHATEPLSPPTVAQPPHPLSIPAPQADPVPAKAQANFKIEFLLLSIGPAAGILWP